MEVVRFGAGRLALKFGQQKINIHEYGREPEPKAHLPVPGSLDLCLIISISTEELLAHLDIHGIGIAEGLNRPGFVGESLVRELRLPEPFLRWKHNTLFLLQQVVCARVAQAADDCCTSPPTSASPAQPLNGFSSSVGVSPPLCTGH